MPPEIMLTAGTKQLTAKPTQTVLGTCWNVRITEDGATVSESTCDRYQLVGLIAEFTLNATA